ncbi:uncharacterized protein LY79DRAFT_579431 [Colletotrichum navitas]|uniref:Uncharacterized protein n=1 Tax=Colletotrichum navitas TaxID=681940 RepID=A0AAD8V584_9PEZI|nr:uncharacterized protein LY79DRAFT_579431 [Colletotrichum navitas]KAK1593344.1 hypothetical protein LY79DRAFT_579431 [Colletotrichum navitas]
MDVIVKAKGATSASDWRRTNIEVYAPLKNWMLDPLTAVLMRPVLLRPHPSWKTLMALILDPIVGTVCFLWPCRLLSTIPTTPAFHSSNCKFADLVSDTTLDASLIEPLTSGQVDDVAGGMRLAASPYAANLRPSFRGHHLGFQEIQDTPAAKTRKTPASRPNFSANPSPTRQLPTRLVRYPNSNTTPRHWGLTAAHDWPSFASLESLHLKLRQDERPEGRIGVLPRRLGVSVCLFTQLFAAMDPLGQDPGFPGKPVCTNTSWSTPH